MKTMTQYKLKYIPFADTIHGIVKGMSCRPEGQDIFTIIIDSRLTESDQAHQLKHELAHLVLGHHEHPERDLKQIEREAEAHAAAMTDEEFNNLRSYERR